MSGFTRPRLLMVGATVVSLAILTIALVPTVAASSQRNEDHQNSTLFATGRIGTALLAIDVQRGTTSVIGSTGQPGSIALAITRNGKAAYSIASAVTGFPPAIDGANAQLAKIDLETGAATLVGSPMGGNLSVMGMTFAPDGVLYAAGDFDPQSPTFNSLYTIDLHTGLATRVGSLGAGPNPTDFIMSFAWDSDGNLYGASMTALFRIHRSRITNMATKVVDFVGSSLVMGIAIDEDGSFYAADFVDPPTFSTIYRVDVETGFLTPLFNTGIAFVHNIAFKPDASDGDHDKG